MNKTKTLSILSAAIIAIGISCSKSDSPVDKDSTVTPAKGLYILNEGSFNAPNSTTLTYYDDSSAKASTDFYKNVNNTLLGSVGNDILIFGSKLYIVMNGSGNLTVMDKNTAKLIKQITASDGDEWQPRYVIPYNDKLLVSAYDGTVSVIDTSSLTITNTIKVGTTPEGLAVFGNTLYVANSGGLNYPNYDSTVSVVDLNTLTETMRIKVAVNPQKVAADSKGNIYVFNWGNYGDVSPKVYKIDATTLSVVDSSAATPFYDKMTVYKNVLYFDGGNTPVTTLSTNNLQGNFTDFVTDGTTLTNPYGINIDENNGDVYVTDAENYVSVGKVYCFDKTGKLKFDSFDAGTSPDKVVFLR